MEYLSTRTAKHLLVFVIQIFAVTAMAVPDSITMQLKIRKPDGTTMDAASVNFQYTTLDPLGTCVLYVEQFAGVNMATSSGLVVHNLGTGTQIYSATGSSTFTPIFDNQTASLPCQAGGTYAPANVDRRKIVVQFNDGTGTGWQTLQAININSVPYANYAGDSVRLGTHPAADFTLKAGFPDCATSSKVLTYNGSAFTCISPSTGGGTVTNVTSANSYLTVATSTSTPALTVNVGTAANTLAAGNDTRITGSLQKTNNLSDVTSVTTARTNLGLGTAAVLDAGTAANNVPQLDSGGKILASVLPTTTVTSSTTLVGDVTGTIAATVVSTVGTKTAAQVAQSVTDTLAATNANTASTIVKRDASGNIAVTNLSSTNVSTQNNYLYDNTNTNKIILKAPATGITNYTFTLPAVIGTANQIVGYDAAGSVLENKSITAGSGITVTHSAGGIQISSGAGAGTVTTVTSANTDIGVATTTTTPVLTLNSGTAANQIVKLDGSAKLPAVDGSALTNLTATNLSGAVPIAKGGTNATTPAAALNNLLPTQTSNGGKVLQTDGTNATWQAASGGTVTAVTSANAYLTVATGTSTPAITAVVGTAANTLAAGNDTRIVNAVQQSAYNGDVASVLDSNCGAGSAPKWNIATDMWSCVAIGSLDASTITTGTISAARLPATASFWSDAGSGKINYNGGNVGIGTATPAYPLTVSGTTVGIGTGTITFVQAATNVGISNITADDKNGVVIGRSNNTGNADSSIAVGVNNAVGRDSGTVFGYNNSVSANGYFAMLFGRSNTTSGTNTIAVGESNTISADNAMAFGSNITNATASSLQIGPSNTAKVTILSTGNVGIGTATPAAPLEIKSATAGVSGLRFTNLTSTSTPAANSNRVLSVSTTGDVQLNSPALPFYSINGTTSATSVARDYNTVAALGTNVAISDVITSVSNGPANLGWFAAVYTAANSSTNPYTSQFALSDLGAAFRGGQTPNIGSAVWQKFLTMPASRNFFVGASGSDITLINGDNGYLSIGANNVERLRIIAGGNVGIRTTTPTAFLNIAAGTATAGTAPLKLTAGTNLTTAESGAIEFDGTNLYYTDSTPARRTIATTAGGAYTGVSSIANSGGNISLSPNSTTGTVQVTSTTASTGASNGALVVNGGVGVGGDIYASASINSGSSIYANTTITAGTSVLSPQIYGSSAASGTIKIDGTSNATKGAVLLNSAGGNVGIGNTTPRAPLHVSTVSAIGLTYGAVLQNPNTNVGAGVALAFKSDADNSGLLYNKGGIIFQRGATGNGDLYFAVNSAANSTNVTIADSKLTILSTGGYVGVGTNTPAVALDVQGQIRSRVFDDTSLTTIDWNNGNIQYTTDSCQAYAFTNVMDGASYTFTVKGATSAQCTFSQSGLTFHYTPSNGVTNASTHTIYTLFRAGSDVYVSWVTGL